MVQSVEPDVVGDDRRGTRVGGFLEDQVVAVEAERIADELKRDVVVAAERELVEQIDLRDARNRRSISVRLT